MKQLTVRLFSFLLTGIMLMMMSGCGESDATSSNKIPPVPVLTKITISPAGLTLPIKQSSSYSAIGIYSDGSVVDITQKAIWDSSNKEVAVVSKNTVTAIASGSTEISAKFDNIVGKTTLTVLDTALVSIEIQRGDAYYNNNSNDFVIGSKIQAKAIGTFNNGLKWDITQNVDWTTDTPSTINVDKHGLITAVGLGSAHVKASYKYDNNTVEVKDEVSGIVEAPALLSIDIIGDHISTTDKTIILRAMAYYDNNLEVDVTDQVIWNSFDDNVTVVDGIVSAKIATRDIIKVILHQEDGTDYTARHWVSFTNKELKYIEIQEGWTEDGSGKVLNDSTIDIPLLDKVIQPGGDESANGYYLTTWAVYTDGTKEYVNTDTFYWSDDQDAVYINFLESSYLYGRDLTQGVTVTAYYGGKKASFKVNVKNINTPALQSIELRYGSGETADITEKTVNLGLKRRFWLEAWGHFDDGTIQNINRSVFYSSSNRKIAGIYDVIDSYVYGRSEGDANITAQWQGKSAYVTVHVLPKNEIGDDQTAKNAASLNGVLYPVVVPVFSALRTFIDSGDVNGAISNPDGKITVDCDPDDDTRGTYTITRSDNKVVIDYGVGTCKAKNAESVTKRAIAECGFTFLGDGNNGLPIIGFTIPDDNVTTNAGTYYVLTEGRITCEKVKVTDTTTISMKLENHKSEMHNHPDGKNSVWTHNMTLTLVHKDDDKTILDGDGYAHGILYDGEVDGVNSSVLSDETYYANEFAMTLDMSAYEADSLIASGTIGYYLKSSFRYPEDAGKYYTIYFDNYGYTLDGIADELSINVNGRIGSNCMGGMVEYTTSELLIDNEQNKDVNESRIPQSGQLDIVSIENTTDEATSTRAFMTFNENNPRIEIGIGTGSQPFKEYDAWRDITTTSECSILQEFIDRASN